MQFIRRSSWPLPELWNVTHHHWHCFNLIYNNDQRSKYISDRDPISGSKLVAVVGVIRGSVANSPMKFPLFKWQDHHKPCTQGETDWHWRGGIWWSKKKQKKNIYIENRNRDRECRWCLERETRGDEQTNTDGVSITVLSIISSDGLADKGDVA